MTIIFHPDPGVVLVCDYAGFKVPEMTKRRPVIVVSPRFRDRDKLCTVVPLSTTAPKRVCPYHCEIVFDPLLPEPYNSPRMWVKADMLCAVSFERLTLLAAGKDEEGKRIYDVRHISDEDLRRVRDCVLMGLGFGP